ncbi:MAG: transposase [Gammaproteobacteria bacterium]|nr:transposase [Gammaproteobacteria bacterium]
MRTQTLAIAQVRWLLQSLPKLLVVELVVDDTMVLRHSTKAPGTAIRYDHSHKCNRPSYVLAQNWVGLALTLRTQSGKAISFPIRLRLVPSTGNTHKLKIAGALLRAFIPHIPVPARLLTDAWFMRRRLLLPLLRRHGQFIGQVRKDTVLLRDPPPKTSKRGRPRIYGDKVTPEEIAALPTETVSLHVYGKWQKVRLQSIVANARFLKGHPVRAVWSAIYDEKLRRWSPPPASISLPRPT